MTNADATLPDGMRLRPMRRDDYPAVMALWREAEGVGLSDVDSEEAIGRYLDRNPEMSFVAEADGAIAGAALCGQDGRRGYLHHMAVATAWRRRGVGRALAERCFQALRREGFTKCHLFVHAGNQQALAFWRRLGWLDRTDIVMLSRTAKAKDPKD